MIYDKVLPTSSTAGLVIAVIAISTVFLLSTMVQSHASSSPKSINVQLGNKSYTLPYDMSNGSSIVRAEAVSYQPYGGELILYPNATTDGFLDVTFPREFYDVIGFTDHDNEEIAVIVDGRFVLPMNATYSCDKITAWLPIEAGIEEVAFVTSDILAEHTHPYPPILDVKKKVTVDGAEFDIQVSTDAIRCDVSFSKEEKKLHIDIEGRDNTEGSFTIGVPRQLLGGNYTVTVDGKPADNLQIYTTALGSLDGTDPNTSTISFSYSAGAKSIDIIGTTVIPEFGTISLVVGAVGVASVLFLSSRKLRTIGC